MGSCGVAEQGEVNCDRESGRASSLKCQQGDGIPSRGDNTCSNWSKYREHKTGLEVEMCEKGWVMGLSSEMEGGNQGV